MALGEYGSAFNTLIVSVNYTPDTIYYGLGRSYVAGFFSVIPLLVAQIPSLHEAAIFFDSVTKINSLFFWWIVLRRIIL